MPYAETDDGVRLYFEETGDGLPVLFVHEFAGDCRSWEAQLRHFARRYRCIAFNARGFPPSDVPEDAARYSQLRARDDIRAVLDHLALGAAHVVGLSMGGFAALHFAFAWPDRTRSLAIGGVGYGAEPEKRDSFRREAEAAARGFEGAGSRGFARTYAQGPTRVQFQNKDPRGWQAFADMLADHSARGAALTMRGVQKERPSLWDLQDAMRALTVPTLIVTGDEDDACLVPALMMKRTIRSSALAVLPRTGHTVNLEEPDTFNRLLADFLAQVDSGRWAMRDPRSMGDSILGTGADGGT
jgi:pimeloyl-ACP methyl ester carboxylesterase